MALQHPVGDGYDGFPEHADINPDIQTYTQPFMVVCLGTELGTMTSSPEPSSPVLTARLPSIRQELLLGYRWLDMLASLNSVSSLLLLLLSQYLNSSPFFVSSLDGLLPFTIVFQLLSLSHLLR